MRTFGFLIVLLLVTPLTLRAQDKEAQEGATISSAQVSGLDLASLSPGLQEQIGGLAGRPLLRDRLQELAARIEAEQPRYVAAVRAVVDPDGEVRVVFVVAQLRNQDLESNVNARYVVERVEIHGVRESDIARPLRDDLQTLSGKPLDQDEAGKLETRLRDALPDYEVSRRIRRGSRSGQIRLLFVLNRAEASRWLQFEPLESKFVYHTEQGWGGYLDLPFGSRNFRITPIIAIDNADDLVEEYSGFGLRFETRKLGTERLGASLEWSTFNQDWRDVTLNALAANPALPPAYDGRTTVTPLVTVALTRHVRFSAGVGISEVEPLSGVPESQMANAAIGSLGYSQHWEGSSGPRHDVDTGLLVRAGSEALESDYVYTRTFAQGLYRYSWSKHSVLLSGMAGGISGAAPLFERFSLGDSQTLRGWDKYAITPTGGDRMFHASVEYDYRGLALFLDTGSVWDHGHEAHTRVSVGGGYNPGPVFFTIGFPLNTDEVSAVFTMGIRFSGIGIQKY